MSEELSESKILKVLDWSYDIAVNGVSGLDSASEMAEDYMKNDDSSIVQANTLIRWQNTKAGTTAFLAGLGGIITMPIPIPTNITSVIDVQIRMIAFIHSQYFLFRGHLREIYVFQVPFQFGCTQ